MTKLSASFDSQLAEKEKSFSKKSEQQQQQIQKREEEVKQREEDIMGLKAKVDTLERDLG